MLRRISRANAHIRKCVRLSDIFKNLKCRQRCESATRWSWAYLIHLIAYNRGAFDSNDELSQDDANELKCPIEKDKVEIYLQILRPVYLFSLNLQSNHSTIANVIPGLLKVINILETMVLDPRPRLLCSNMIKTLKAKFDFELNAPIYLAASVLRVSGLKH